MLTPAVARMLRFTAVLTLAVGLPGTALAADDDGAQVSLRSIVDGLAVPVEMAQPDDGTDRLFVVDQVGRIVVVDGGSSSVFLDLTDDIVEIEARYDERGMLGLAFHPSYQDNGRFFVYYSAPLQDGAPEGWNHTSHISEFSVSSDDANRADPDSETLLLAIDQPYHNHNGGQILFGHDGYLYIGLGDGGNGGDVDDEGDDLGRPEDGNGQTPTTILGNILRIDVDNGDPYGIPEDNPFASNGDGVPEIYAMGFRNPYGMSIDHDTGDIYTVDAGQARYEEVSRLELGGNFGWNIKEGTHCFDPDDHLNPPEDCPDTDARGEPLIDPVIEYERGPDTGSVITAGVMYRGDRIPELQDRFVFADYATIRFLPTGIMYVATPTDDEPWPVERLSLGRDFDRFVLGVAHDLDGDLYLLTSESGGPAGTTGEVFAVDAADAADETDLAAWWPVIVVVFAGAGAGFAAWRIRRRPENRAPS